MCAPATIGGHGVRQKSRTLENRFGFLLFGGASRNRTDVHGFAIRCITTLPLRHGLPITFARATRLVSVLVSENPKLYTNGRLPHEGRVASMRQDDRRRNFIRLSSRSSRYCCQPNPSFFPRRP